MGVETLSAAIAAERAPAEAVRPGALVWLVVVTKGLQEKRAVEQLENQRRAFGDGFEVYLPLKLGYRERQRELVSTPFFPRYVFARVDLRLASWKRIWSTRAVHGVLGSSPERPFAVADWVIERLRAQEDAGFIRLGLQEDRAGKATFEKDQAVRLSGSPLEAVFLEPVDEKRAAILVSLLGRESRVTVDLAKLRSAAKG